MTLEDIKKKYKEKEAVFCEKKSAIEAEKNIILSKIEQRKEQIKRLETKLLKKKEERYALLYPSQRDDILAPIAEEIKNRAGLAAVKIYGPFGIDCEISAYIEDAAGKDVYALHMVGAKEDGTLMYRDYSVNSNRYKEGSIGWMNGMNFPCKPLPGTIEEIMEIAFVPEEKR